MARLSLLPRDRTFFDLFIEAGQNTVKTAKLLDEMMGTWPDSGDLAQQVVEAEHEGDRITHEIVQRLNSTFVTPIDREDIHLLASRLDNVIDQIDGAARRFQMFRIAVRREPAVELCAILIRMGEAIEAAVTNVKKPSHVVERGREIKRLEEEGDALYHAAMGGLFEGTPDPLEVIKWKELYDKVEGALDECEDVANTLDSIALKNG